MTDKKCHRPSVLLLLFLVFAMLLLTACGTLEIDIEPTHWRAGAVSRLPRYGAWMGVGWLSFLGMPLPTRRACGLCGPMGNKKNITLTKALPLSGARTGTGWSLAPRRRV